MKTYRMIVGWLALLAFAVINLAAVTARAQGTAFTYQGRLNGAGSPANGTYDLRFGLYNAASAGSQQGSLLTNSATLVTNGLFTVTLDFGTGMFPGAGRWLEIGVRTNGAGAFTTLSPRQPLTPAPYAVMANTASNLLGTLPTTQLGGTVANSQLAHSTITVAAGMGLSGGGTATLGGAMTLYNAGVLSVTGNADITATNVSGAVTLGDTATSTNTANTMVKRDAAGNFYAGSIYLSTNLYLPAPAAGAGMIYSGSTPFVYASGSGAMNFFAGFGAGNLTMNGNFNTAVGYNALDADTTGGNNTAYGYGALGANTTGYENLASGVNALAFNVSGSQNVADGAAALYRNTNGAANTASGYYALGFNKSGSGNTAVGYYALNQNTTGSNNIALGYQAGNNLTTGSSNIDIGNPGLASDTNIIRIGSGQTQTFIAGTLNANGAGLTNLNINMANFGGLLPKSRIDDGGDAAYEQFLEPAKSLSAAAPLPFSNLSLVSSNSGTAPSFTFLLNGVAFGEVAGFVGHEAMSEPYEFVVEVTAHISALDPDAQLGRPGALTFARNGRSTTFAGIISGCSVSTYDESSALYTFRIESPLAWLALSTDYRVNQNTTVPDLVANLYNSVTTYTASRSLAGSHDPRESVIQFGETDLNFFSRLTEDEGIFYFFGLSGSPPTLILGDNTGAYLSAPNSPFSYYGDTATNAPLAAEYIQAFQKANRESVITSTIRAYNFKTPAVNLQGTYSAAEGRGEQYQFGSSANTIPALGAQAQLRVERQTVERNTTFGTGNAPDLRPGCTFTLNDTTGAGLGGSYLVTAVRHGAFRRLTNGVASLYYGNEFEVIPASMVYRPALKTPKPMAQPCTAVVTGPAGEEIYTDTYGRVKVQFHWDRYGANNENSSAWLRVASLWAGNQWGMLFLPRIGQEVMVDFVQGDPDQPVITGSFYNATHMPPYSLPDNKTVSTIKTRSSKGGTAANYNEIRFEDKKGSEALDITAEKNLTLTAENNLTNSAGNDMTISASHNMTTLASLDMTTSASRNLAISAGNNLTLSSSQGVGINTANDPAFALNVNGTVKATAFQGNGSGLSSLPTNVAYLNSNQIFSAQTIFTGPVAMFNLQIYSYLGMNDKDLYLRTTPDHGLGWYGGTKLFAGNSLDGPVLYGYAGGGLGTFQTGTSTNLVLTWNSSGKVGIGTNAPTATLDVVGDGRVRGLFRSGSESGTAEAPNPAGLVVRRVNSTAITSNTVVAVARTLNSTTNITLVRDGTAGGFQIKYPAAPGNVTVACMGIDDSGTARNFYTTLASPANAGTVQIYANSLGVVHFECTFGITANAGQHLTQVALSRYETDTNWSGTLMSTYNQ